VLADPPERWSALHFLVDDGVCQLGAVRLRLADDGPRRGILSWSLRGLRAERAELDGLDRLIAKLEAGKLTRREFERLAIADVRFTSADLGEAANTMKAKGYDIFVTQS
jgi:hypothetical protein